MFYLPKNHLSIQEGYGVDRSDEDIDDYNSNKKIDRINDIVNSCHWYNKTLFNLFYKDGYKLREISAMTGINLKSVSYTIKKTREEIKKQLKNDRNIN
jgi:DNA-directed RNA polymerase specialized sigma24 family protein